MSGPPIGTRVLLVEDETIIAMMAEDMLEDMGCTIAASAATLADALAAAARGGFDIALLDMNLHGEMSLPVAALLRAAGRPFLFTTGYGAAAGLDTDFADVPVVRKPYGLTDLAHAMRAVLG
jgi:CheY-like chemotaxis protein